MSNQVIRVLIVDDSAFMRTVISQMLAAAPDIEVVGQAADGKEGLRLARDLKPDVITLDVEMPILSGLETLPILMRSHPTPVIMLSTLTEEGAEVTIKALELGAVDYLPKNMEGGPLGMRHIAPELIAKVRAIGAGNTREALIQSMRRSTPRPVQETTQATGPGLASNYFPVVAIGCSTGGPTALSSLLPQFPTDFSGAILVVQHMPATFTNALAQRLDGLCGLAVKQAEEGAPIIPGTILVAKGGHHLTVRKEHGGLVAHLSDAPKCPTMPAVDELFRSLAEVCPERTLGAVLTGMGQDGLEGARALSAAGSPVLAQAETGCLVYGMPKAVVDAGLAADAVQLSEMYNTIYLNLPTGSPSRPLVG
ncbi:MAG: chemotaxis response regulator protein-glutamate methylesterase [Leptospirillia bacterium]